MTLKINADGPTEMQFNPARWKSIREMNSSRVAMNIETNANDYRKRLNFFELRKNKDEHSPHISSSQTVVQSEPRRCTITVLQRTSRLNLRKRDDD
jgi:hypothetical protein